MPGHTTRLLVAMLMASAGLTVAACAGRSFSQSASHARTNASPAPAPAANDNKPPMLFPVSIAQQYEAADDFSEGLAAVKIKGRWGYIDKAGRTVIKPQFDNAEKFIEGIAAVSVGWANGDVPQTKAKGGYIDRTGKYVWPPSR